MGNQNQKLLPAGYDPVLNGWEIKEKNEEYNVWRNPQTGEQVDEYRRVFNDRRDYNFERDTFEFRHSSSTLVASVYMKQQTQQDVCTTFYRANFFLQHISHRLSEIEHIPYPDVLHIYHQAFRGFAELYDRVGYFEVDENMICMNKQGIVKVWLNPDLSRGVPLHKVPECMPSESNMVRQVINVIHANTDHLTLPENILDTMRKSNVSTFREADGVLQQVAVRHRTLIPGQLDCVLELDMQPFREVRRTVVTQNAPGRLLALAETYPAPSIVTTGISAIPSVAPPAIVQTAPIVASPSPIVTSTVVSGPPAVTATAVRPAALQLRPSRIVTAAAPLVKPQSVGGTARIVTSQGSRTNLSPYFIGKPATSAIRYQTVPAGLSRIQFGTGSVPQAPPAPIVRAQPPKKAVSAINFTSPFQINQAAPKASLCTVLPTIAQKPGPQMKKVLAPTQVTQLPVRRSPSIKVQAQPPPSVIKTESKVQVNKVESKAEAATARNSEIRVNQINTSNGAFFKPASNTKPSTASGQPIAPQPLKVPNNEPTVGGFVRSATSPVAVLDNNEKKTSEFTTDQFFEKLGIKKQQQSSNTVSYTYESKTIQIVSPTPAPLAQPTTHTNNASIDGVNIPMSVSLTDNVTNSIAGHNKYQYQNYTSSALAGGVSVLPGESTFYQKTSNEFTAIQEKIAQIDRKQSPKKQEISYKAQTGSRSHISPPKVQFTYSSSNIPAAPNSRTVFEGGASLTSEAYGSQVYESKVFDSRAIDAKALETRPSEGRGYQSISYDSKGYSGAGFSYETITQEKVSENYKRETAGSTDYTTNITSAFTGGFGYIPATSTTSYEITSSQAAATFGTKDVPIASSYTGLSPPNSRVAVKLMNLSPPKTSPTKNTLQDSISYSTSQAYQSSAHSFITNQASHVATVPSSSYQPLPTVNSFKATAGGSYQGSCPCTNQVSTALHSYSVQMDTELLKDLQKLKKQGTLSPKKEQMQDFQMSFGNNSGYIRDSLKNNAGKL